MYVYCVLYNNLVLDDAVRFKVRSFIPGRFYCTVLQPDIVCAYAEGHLNIISYMNLK